MDTTAAVDPAEWNEMQALLANPPAVAPGTLSLIHRTGVRPEDLFLGALDITRKVEQLATAEVATLTPIPEGLPTIGPGTLALLRKHDVLTAFDVLKVTRPSVEGVGPARWAVLEEWAGQQGPDRARIVAALPIWEAHQAASAFETARRAYDDWEYKSREVSGAEAWLASTSTVAARAHRAALVQCLKAARAGFTAPLVAFRDWDAANRRAAEAQGAGAAGREPTRRGGQRAGAAGRAGRAPPRGATQDRVDGDPPGARPRLCGLLHRRRQRESRPERERAGRAAGRGARLRWRLPARPPPRRPTRRPHGATDDGTDPRGAFSAAAAATTRAAARMPRADRSERCEQPPDRGVAVARAVEVERERDATTANVGCRAAASRRIAPPCERIASLALAEGATRRGVGELFGALGVNDNPTASKGAQSGNDELLRAGSFLYYVYDELRRGVRYARWHEDDLNAFAPPFTGGRGPRTAKTTGDAVPDTPARPGLAGAPATPDAHGPAGQDASGPKPGP